MNWLNNLNIYVVQYIFDRLVNSLARRNSNMTIKLESTTNFNLELFVLKNRGNYPGKLDQNEIAKFLPQTLFLMI